jgi:hypothetical protein
MKSWQSWQDGMLESAEVIGTTSMGRGLLAGHADVIFDGSALATISSKATRCRLSDSGGDKYEAPAQR